MPVVRLLQRFGEIRRRTSRRPFSTGRRRRSCLIAACGSPGYVVARQVAGLFEAVEQIVALLVDVGRGDVRDLAGGAAQADVGVVHCRADPNRPASSLVCSSSRIAHGAGAADCRRPAVRTRRLLCGRTDTGCSPAPRRRAARAPCRAAILRSLLMPSAAAGYQPAAFMIVSSCSCVPISATLSGSPGWWSPVSVIRGLASSAGWCLA